MRDNRIILQAAAIDGKAMVLRGDLDIVTLSTSYRLVATAMTEFQLVGLAAQRNREQLVAEADAKEWNLAEQLADVLLGISDRLRVSWSVAEENAIGLHRQNFFCWRIGRHNSYCAAFTDQVTQDVVFDAEVVGDDFVLSWALSFFITVGQIPGSLVPVVTLLAGYFLDKVLADDRRSRLGFCHQAVNIQVNG